MHLLNTVHFLGPGKELWSSHEVQRFAPTSKTLPPSLCTSSHSATSPSFNISSAWPTSTYYHLLICNYEHKGANALPHPSLQFELPPQKSCRLAQRPVLSVYQCCNVRQPSQVVEDSRCMLSKNSLLGFCTAFSPRATRQKPYHTNVQTHQRTLYSSFPAELRPPQIRATSTTKELFSFLSSNWAGAVTASDMTRNFLNATPKPHLGKTVPILYILVTWCLSF